MKDYIERANKAKRIPFQYTNKEEVLNKLGLLKEDKLINAGKVLFCDNNKVELQMAIFATDTKTTFIDIDKVENKFQEYVSKFNSKQGRIKLKIDHIKRVAEKEFWTILL